MSLKSDSRASTEAAAFGAGECLERFDMTRLQRIGAADVAAITQSRQISELHESIRHLAHR